MRIPSSKTFVFLAFSLGLVSVAINTILVSNINTRLRAADSEYFGLVDRLNKQVGQLNETQQEFATYRIMHHIAFSSPEEKRVDARWDATEMLKLFLMRYWAAANDISQLDMIRINLEESENFPNRKKLLELGLMIQESRDPAERARLTAEAERIIDEEAPPKSESAKKLREIVKYSEAESTAKNERELWSSLMPALNSLWEQIAESIRKKEGRMRELERQRSSLKSKAEYATYAAVSLQIFSLMLVLSKDWAKDIRDRSGGQRASKGVGQ